MHMTGPGIYLLVFGKQQGIVRPVTRSRGQGPVTARRQHEHRGMRADDDRCRIIHIRKVFLQPFPDIVSEPLVIIFKLSRRIQLHYQVIHHDDMELSGIEGIIPRAQIVLETGSASFIIGGRRVIVMISDDTVHGAIQPCKPVAIIRI